MADVHVTLGDGTEYPVKVDNLGNGLLGGISPKTEGPRGECCSLWSCAPLWNTGVQTSKLLQVIKRLFIKSASPKLAFSTMHHCVALVPITQ